MQINILNRYIRVHENLRKHLTMPRLSGIIQKKVLDWSWFVLLHQPYSPDLAARDFHIFSSLQNALNDKKILSRRSDENLCGKRLELELAVFYSGGFNKLLNKWQEVTENYGEYTIDWN